MGLVVPTYKLTRQVKPVWIIGDLDNQRPDKQSSTVFYFTGRQEFTVIFSQYWNSTRLDHCFKSEKQLIAVSEKWLSVTLLFEVDWSYRIHISG